MVKITIAMIANSMSINGISTVIMNYCRCLDPSKFAVTILAGSPVDNSYLEECHALGIRIIELPERKKDPVAFYKRLIKELHVRKFEIVHIHGNSATITPELLISYFCGVKIRIAHIHSSTCDNKYIHRLFLPLFNRLYTHGMACSSKAGKWIFSRKKFYIIPNGFITDRFKFSSASRVEIRKELGIKDEILLGHVGRMNYQKNQGFLIELFNEIADERRDIMLALIGTGPDENKIRELWNTSEFKDRILMLGEQKHPEKYYSAFDAFLFPSLHEGLGIVALEAQICGLPCAVSDSVPVDVKLGDNISFISLKDRHSWKNWILNLKTETSEREKFYQNNLEHISEYDISNSVDYLEKLYMAFVQA